jgi:hypothetical protein
MVQTLKVSFAIGRHVPQGGFAYWNEGRWEKPLGSRIMVVNALRAGDARVYVHKLNLQNGQLKRESTS